MEIRREKGKVKTCRMESKTDSATLPVGCRLLKSGNCSRYRFLSCLVWVGFFATGMLSADGWSLIPAGAPFYTPDTGIGVGVYAILCSAIPQSGKEDGEEADPNNQVQPGKPAQLKGNQGQGKPAEVVFFFSGTQNLQASLGVQPEWYVLNDQYRIAGYMELSHYPASFWGLGSNTGMEQEETYKPSTLLGKGSVYRRFSPHLYAGPRLSYRYSEIEPGPLLSSIRGGEGGSALGIGLGGVWDSRNSSFYPTGGILAEGSFELYRRAWGSDWDYSVFQLDIRGYIPIGKKGVFALQGKVQTAYGEVPFQSYPALGGSTLMRGYPMGRFQDMSSLALQGEYRFPFSGRFGGVLFLGAGDVAPSLVEHFARINSRIVGGGGLRFLLDPQRRINARLDVGFTAEGMGVYLLVKEAF